MQRIRIETWDNVTSFDENSGAGNSYFRNRTSLSASWFPKPGIELTARMTNEFKKYLVPENRHFNWNEIFVDLLYAKFDSALGSPHRLTIGRQNLLFGEGFLVADGGPLDGSRSAYFNALRFDYVLNSNNSFTIFGVYQPEKDNLLPRINNRNQAMVEEDEDGAGLYWTGKISKYGLEGYWIHKNVYHGEHRALLPESRLNCLGARAAVPIYRGLSFIGEGAYQVGTTAGEDHRAFGGYAYGTYETGWPMGFPKFFTLGSIYLSGDNYRTLKVERWDPMFARWPKWGESYIYAFIWEYRVAYWTDMVSYFFKTGADITNGLAFSFDYYHLRAPYGRPSAIPEEIPEKNVERGNLFIGRILYKFGTNVTGHVIWEGFKPGDYYFEGADDYSWARMELMLKF